MEVSKIFLFPFKSIRGIEVESAYIDEHGFRYDRLYMLAHKDKNGKWSAVTQRGEPAMARIKTKVRDKTHLVLEYQDLQAELPLDISGFGDDLPIVPMELWGFPMECKNIMSVVSGLRELFSAFFKSIDSSYSQRIANDDIENLAVVVSGKRRVVPQKYLDKEVTSSFQDIWPGTLMTTASFEDLERHVEYMDETAKISMDSFRMNMLITTDDPWIEDDWKRIQIGEHEWIVLMQCERCSMPAVDQETGITRKNKHPLPSLNRFRILQKGKTPCFGLNLLNTDSGFKLNVGDKVKVLESEA